MRSLRWLVLPFFAACNSSATVAETVTPPAEPVLARPVPTTPAAKPAAAAAAEAISNPDGLRPALGLMPDYQAGDDGVVVQALREGGAAATAGMKEGDLILKVNGIRVGDVQSYSDLLDEQKIGSTIPVCVRRDGKELDLQVVVGSRPGR